MFSSKENTITSLDIYFTKRFREEVMPSQEWSTTKKPYLPTNVSLQKKVLGGVGQL